MPVYKRKIKNKVKYFAQVNFVDLNGNYKAKNSKYFDTKKEAEIEEVRILSGLKSENKNDTTMDELYLAYLANQKDIVKPQTYRKYKSIYSHVKKTLGKFKLSKLTVQHVLLFKKALNDNPKVNTDYKNKIYRMVKSMLKFADKRYDIKVNVFDKVEGFSNPTEIKKEMQFYTYDEFKKFISYFDDDLIFKTLFKVLYFQGTRIGEANALTWNDVDFAKKTIRINKTVTSKVKGVDYFVSSPKTYKSTRTIPLENSILSDLIKLRSYYTSFDNYSSKWFVFGGIRPLSETTVTNKKNLACKAMDLKVIRIHDFRHSCASLYINLGWQPILISKLLGHSKVSITLDTYSHLYPSEMSAAIASVSEMLEKNK